MRPAMRPMREHLDWELGRMWRCDGAGDTERPSTRSAIYTVCNQRGIYPSMDPKTPSTPFHHLHLMSGCLFVSSLGERRSPRTRAAASAPVPLSLSFLPRSSSEALRRSPPFSVRLLPGRSS